MTYLIEQLINGVCQGAIYALFAIGYTMHRTHFPISGQ